MTESTPDPDRPSEPVASATQHAGPPTSHHASRLRRAEAEAARGGGLTREAKVGAALAAAVGAAIVLGILFFGTFFDGRILPGVRVAGIDVGGQTIEAAAERLKALPAYRGQVTLRDPRDRRTWSFDPRALGIDDPAALATTAYEVGRGGAGDPLALAANPLTLGWHQLQLWRTGFDLPGTYMLRRGQTEAALNALAPKVDVPPKNAGLNVEHGALKIIPSQLGRQLNTQRTADLLALALDDPARVREPGPLMLDIATVPTGARVPDLNNVADAYERITSSGITMTFRAQYTYPISAAQLAAWTSLTQTKNANGDLVAAIQMDRAAIAAWLAPAAQAIAKPPRDARFRYDAGGLAVKDPGSGGFTLDVDASVGKVIEVAYSELRYGELAVRVQAAEVPPEMASELDASDELGELAIAYTRFSGTPEGYTANLGRAVDAVDGVLLPPGAEFSFNRALGEVSAERGYDMAFANPSPGVTGTRGAPADLGGPVGQLATTVFRAAFWEGLPITQRHAPATRVGWYEPPVGLDAAVNGADQDLVFANDSTHYLLVSAYMDTQRGAVAVRLYGVASGRRVEVTGPLVTNLTPPGPPQQRRVAGLPAGTRVQIAFAREGADVRVERIVRAGGRTVASDVFQSRYAPAGDVTVIGGP